MTGTATPEHAGSEHGGPGSVLAVMVAYRRAPEEAASWRWLMDRLAEGRTTGDTRSLRLAHVLIYDNTPGDSTPGGTAADSGTALPEGVSRIADPSNGGTAAADEAACALAGRMGCEWVLLLDQDTSVPADYLRKAGDAAARPDRPGILAPKVLHGEILISPAEMKVTGRVVPRADADQTGHLTAIASGLMLRQTDLARALPLPPALWLDFVDHWVLLKMRQNGTKSAVIDTVLSHDLSIFKPAEMSTERMIGILDAESWFHRHLSWQAWAALPLLRLIRVTFYGRFNRPLAWLILRRAFGDLFTRKVD